MSSPRSSIRSAILVPVLAGALIALFAVCGASARGATPLAGCSAFTDVQFCPNLVAGRFTAKLIDGDRKLELDGSATNAGSAASPPTTLQVTIGNDALKPESLQGLAVKQTLALTLVEDVPVDVRGTAKPVTVNLDPGNNVAETTKADNAYTTKAFFTALPDLALGTATPQVERGDTILVSVPVVNRGTADDPISTTLTATAVGVPTATQTVPPLGPGASETVTIALPVPPAARDGAITVTLTIDAADVLAEQDETNNTFTLAPVTITPDLAITNVAPSTHGRSVTLVITVLNAGNTSAPATQVRATAPGWQTTTQPLGALDAGASTHATLTLTAPQAAQGKDVTLTADVVPVPGDSKDNDTKAVTIQIPAPTPTPDLFIVSVHDPPEGHTITLNVDIGNAGSARSHWTRVHASAAGWRAAVASVPPIATGGSTTVPLVLTVPDSARGHRVEFAVNVDPVAGDPAGNNFRRADFPIAPVTVARPDVAVSALIARRDGDNLVVEASVANVGVAAARAITLQLHARGWPAGTRVLDLLRAEDSTRVEFVLAVPPAASGTTADFRLSAVPVRGEVELANNRTTAKFKVPPPPAPGNPWRYVLAGLLGLVAVTVAAGFTLNRRRLLLRLHWQDEATDERPETCEVPQSHVLQGDGKPKPAFRTVEKLGLSVRGADGEEETTSVEGAIVDVLNRALWSQRLRRRRRVHRLVEPLGERLAAEIERWLAEKGDDVDVAVTAELKGGKLEYEFARSQCVREGNECRWQERQKWKGEREHTVEEPVAAVHLPLEPRADRVRQLSAALEALVGRVDVPRRLRAPEALPVTRQ